MLVSNDPLDVIRVLRPSRASYAKMVQNLARAMGHNAVSIPLPAGVLAPIGVVLSPAIGALSVSLSTVIVAVNAMLLRRVSLTWRRPARPRRQRAARPQLRATEPSHVPSAFNANLKRPVSVAR